MIVLMDMEWVTLRDNQPAATQLAAVRVSDGWFITDSFSRTIRPRRIADVDWDQVGFAGYTQSVFLNAPSLAEVLADFRDWLQPDDTLLWWGDTAAKFFRSLWRTFLAQPLARPNLHASEALRQLVHDGKPTDGSMYALAQARGVALLLPEHRAFNDVRVMCALLRSVDFRMTWINMLASAPRKPVKPSRPRFSVLSNPDIRYLTDGDTMLVHTTNCEAIPADRLIKGYATLLSPIKQGFTPCDCCREAWHTAVRERNSDVMKRSRCSYFSTPHDHYFHRASCACVLDAAELPQGVKRYQTIRDTGRMPCPFCRPLPQQKAVPLIPATPSRKLVKALARQRVAAQEREALLADAQTAQQRADAFTRTATHAAFFAARGYSSFHLAGCGRLTGLSELRSFTRYDEAVAAGFQPCRFCKPSPRHNVTVSVPVNNQTRTDESVQEIIALCRRQGFLCTLDSIALTVETPVALWKLGVTTRPVAVMHQHKAASPRGASPMHRQHRVFLSLRDAVLYIIRHDAELIAALHAEP